MVEPEYRDESEENLGVTVPCDDVALSDHARAYEEIIETLQERLSA